MMLRQVITLSAIGWLTWVPTASSQTCNQPSATASTIHFRKDCTNHGDCIDDSPGCGLAAVRTWLWGTRSPGPGDAVVVDIGPGDFDGTFQCTGGDGHVTLRGQGREATRIVPSSG